MYLIVGGPIKEGGGVNHFFIFSEFAPKLCKFRRIRTVLKNSGKSKNYFHKKGGGS